jgi:hypothetical protein
MALRPGWHWIVAASAAALASAVVSACVAGPASTASPAVDSRSTPSATAAPTKSPAPTATPSLDPTLAMLQGTWATAPVPVDEVLATVRASEVSHEPLAAYYGAAGAETVTFKLRFLGDQLAWIEVLDDGADEVGATGPFWIEDGNIIVFPDTSGPGQVRVEFSVAGGTLTVAADPEAQTTAGRSDPMALAAVAAWFNSAPYTRVTE